MRNAIWILVSIFFCGVIVIGIRWYMATKRSMVRNSGAIARVETHNRMNARAVYAELAGLSAVDQTTDALIPTLKISDSDEIKALKTANTDTGQVLDNWGNPIKLRIVGNHPVRVVFTSHGANGRDDAGEGDDIVVEEVLE